MPETDDPTDKKRRTIGNMVLFSRFLALACRRGEIGLTKIYGNSLALFDFQNSGGKMNLSPYRPIAASGARHPFSY